MHIIFIRDEQSKLVEAIILHSENHVTIIRSNIADNFGIISASFSNLKLFLTLHNARVKFAKII